MSVSQTHIGSTKQVVMLPFAAVNITDASFTLNAYPPGTQSVATRDYTMPYNGSILGFTGALTEALTDGTLQGTALKNGTALTTWTGKALQQETPQYIYVTQEGRKSGYTFVKGDRLGMVIHKSGAATVAPTTADGVFTLIVLLEGVEY